MEYELVGRNLVIRLPEELDHHSCQTLRQDTEQCLENYDIARIVLDFSAVSFMDSTGIGVILGRYKRMRELGGDVALYGAGRRIRKLIRMSGIEKLAQVCETVIAENQGAYPELLENKESNLTAQKHLKGGATC